jgi:Domain of unknown function (DUF4271)
LKQLFFLLFFCVYSFLLPAQVVKDSIAPVKNDSPVTIPADSNSVIPALTSLDSAKVDSAAVIKKDTVKSAAEVYYNKIESVLKRSTFLNPSGIATATVNQEQERANKDPIFYFLLSLIIFLSFLRYFFSRYFFNLFRVFFNTSLRQGQLTDQLLQAKQASMFFNILFFFTAGVYIYFLLLSVNWLTEKDNLWIMLICSFCMAAIYFFKYLNMKFTGWLTGEQAAANTYLFIIFLINKIVGILLIPVIIIIAFSPDYLKKSAIVISVLMVGVMFLLRFLRSFSLLHRQIKVSRLHFFLYIIGIEALPVLLIYKGVMILLNKNL